MNLSNIVKLHKEILDSYIKDATKDPKKALSEAYQFVKQSASMYYIKGKINPNYNKLLHSLEYLELKCLGAKNMVEFSKTIDATKDSFVSNNLLDYLVWRTRKFLMGDLGKKEIQDLYDWNFQYKCVYASEYFQQLCQQVNAKCEVMTIYPGYDFDVHLDIGISKHCFNIIEYNGKRYLVDLTLAQFFNKNENNIERLGIPELIAPTVGCYLLMTDKGKEIAYKILTDGYIELNEEVLKTYMDAFTLSFRNGLFYEQKDSNFCVPYTVADYERFLASEDSQTNYKQFQYLGRQRKPLKDPGMDFKSIKHVT